MGTLWVETLTLDLNPMLSQGPGRQPPHILPLRPAICVAQAWAAVEQAAHSCPLPDPCFSISHLWD